MTTYKHARSAAFLALWCLPLLPASAYAEAPDMKNCLQLTVKDHTNIILSIQKNVEPITALVRKQNVDVLARSPQTSKSLLVAISKSQILDDTTNQKLDLAASCLSLTPASSIPAKSRAAILEAARELDNADSVPNAIERLGNLQTKYADFNDVREGLMVATTVLRDGQQTIYSEHAFQTLAARSAEQPLAKAKSASEHALDLAVADGKGAVNGGVGGCIAGLLAGGVGCVSGAIAGGVAAAIGNSAQELIEKVWEHAK
ncbi:hypothetical protein [Pseudomonas sp. GZD-222]|uniref:hypothetical protein n=1 Tax=Pseudomonas sp. GZD-222 TaxID=3404805 RepID=UPI003BB5BAA3